MNQALLLAPFATKAPQNIALIRIRFTWLIRSNAVWNEKPNGKKIFIETNGSGVGRASKWTATTTKSYSNSSDFVHVGCVTSDKMHRHNFRNLLSIFFLTNYKIQIVFRSKIHIDWNTKWTVMMLRVLCILRIPCFIVIFSLCFQHVNDTIRGGDPCENCERTFVFVNLHKSETRFVKMS